MYSHRKFAYLIIDNSTIRGDYAQSIDSTKNKDNCKLRVEEKSAVLDADTRHVWLYVLRSGWRGIAISSRVKFENNFCNKILIFMYGHLHGRFIFSEVCADWAIGHRVYVTIPSFHWIRKQNKGLHRESKIWLSFLLRSPLKSQAHLNRTVKVVDWTPCFRCYYWTVRLSHYF